MDHLNVLLRAPLRKGFHNDTLAEGLFPDGNGHEAIELELEDPPVAFPRRGLFQCKIVRPDPRYSHHPSFYGERDLFLFGTFFFKTWRFCDGCCSSTTRPSGTGSEEGCFRPVRPSSMNWVPRLGFWEAMLDCVVNDVANE